MDRREEKKKTGLFHRILLELLDFSRTLLIALAASYVLNTCIIANAQVPSGSMETTVMTGDRIIVNRLAYQFGEPKRGDIVDFILPDDGETPFLKRIIGLPGETIEGKNGVIIIDGKPLTEDYTQIILTEDFGPYLVPEDSYFMMGDNRNNSWDSRYWKIKFVKKEDMLGKAVLSYFPHPRLLQ